MPDIDMDFDERYRGDMIRYAAERYGADHVAQIVTFSTIKARAARSRRGTYRTMGAKTNSTPGDFGCCQIVLQIGGIPFPVLGGRELQRVHEDGRRHDVAAR